MWTRLFLLHFFFCPPIGVSIYYSPLWDTCNSYFVGVFVTGDYDSNVYLRYYYYVILWTFFFFFIRVSFCDSRQRYVPVLKILKRCIIKAKYIFEICRWWKDKKAFGKRVIMVREDNGVVPADKWVSIYDYCNCRCGECRERVSLFVVFK